jgi:hypothetical protein
MITILAIFKKYIAKINFMAAFSKCSVRIYNPPVANNYLGKCLIDHNLSTLKCTGKEGHMYPQALKEKGQPKVGVKWEPKPKSS